MISRYLFIGLFLVFTLSIQGQNQVGIGTNTPEESSVLDIESTTLGIRFPMMSSNRRNNINSPAQGLIVYDTNTDSFWYYNGFSWVQISSSSSGSTDGIGDSDGDTRIQTEFSNDIDQIRIFNNSFEAFRFRNSRMEMQSGSQGVHIGINAGEFDDKSRNRNVYLGTNSGRNGTTANLNVAIGYFTLDSAISSNAMVAIGSNAIARSRTNRRNIAIGDSSLFLNQAANNNLAIGRAAMKNHTSRSNNTAIGLNAMLASVNCANAVAIGHNSLRSAVDRTNLVAIGNSSGRLSTSSRHILIGHQAGGMHTSGNGRLYIDNTNTNNPLMFGNINSDLLVINGNFHVTSNIHYVGDLIDISDRRLKEGIKPIRLSEKQILGLNAFSFSMGKSLEENKSEYGFMAQDVQEVFPDIVKKQSGIDGYLSVSYVQFIPISVEAIKSQHHQMKQQRNRLQQLMQQLDDLEKTLNHMQ